MMLLQEQESHPPKMAMTLGGGAEPHFVEHLLASIKGL